MIQLTLLYINILPDSERLEEVLWLIIFSFLAASFIGFLSIMLFRTIRIADNTYISQLKESYSSVFMEAAFANGYELTEVIAKAAELNKINLTRKKYAGHIIEELFSLYNSFTGESKQNLRELYMRAGFVEYSERKIKSHQWEIQAQGIREVAQMKDQRVIYLIEKLANSKNKLVKENAQLCLVKISGFEGLNFLGDVNAPVSDWQQINLMDALKEHHYTSLPKLSIWLSSSEKTVILFAIRLMSYYQQSDESRKLIDFLNYADKKIKMEAIRALRKLNRRDAIPQLLNIYANEPADVKIEIIKAIAELIDLTQANQFITFLKETNDTHIQTACMNALLELKATDLLKTVEFKDENLMRLADRVIHKN